MTYTIKKEFTLYSKKKGAYNKKTIIGRGLSEEGVRAKLLQLFNLTIPDSISIKEVKKPIMFRIPGLLFPGTIILTQQS